MMKTRKVTLFMAASLLVFALAFGAFQSAFAQGGPGGYDPFMCTTFQDCYWETVVCNDQTGFYETVGLFFDPSGYTMDQIVMGWGIDHSKCSVGHGLKNTYKCKLTDVDTEIYLGTPFEASWIGHASYLRFMKPSGEFNYIAKVDVLTGTVHQDGNEYIGQFSARGKVEPGVYTVQCFGSGGTAGLGIKNVEVVGH
jgi:hypothetical protein